MRDIGRRIQRYRLSRYALPENPLRRRVGWLWIVGVIWLSWVGVLSENSLYRIWRLGRENSTAASDLERARAERHALKAEMENPEARRLREESILRKHGMALPGETVYKIRDVPADSLTH